MFCENTLMLYQQDLQRGPCLVKWQVEIDLTKFIFLFVILCLIYDIT